MSSQLEEALSRTLSSAADGAPTHPPGLLHEVDVRHRRRRRRGYAAVAGVAVLAMTGGVALAVGGLPGRGPGPSVAGVSAAEGAERPPVADVWPEAYHSLVAKLDDGRTYDPVLMINDHEMLVTTNASFENANEVWIIDLDQKRARRVAHLPKPHENRDTFASHFTVGSGHVVWWDSYREDGKAYTRIWKAPLSGGEPALVSTVSGHYGSFGPEIGDRLVVDEGTVYMSHGVTGGVRQVPLSGGEATAVPDTEGYQILQWPWIGTPAGWGAEGADCTLGPDNEPQCKAHDSEPEKCRLRAGDLPLCEGEEPRETPKKVDPSTVKTFTTIRNVETGDERRATVPDGVEGVTCHLTYCVGSKGDGKIVSFQRDGSDLKDLPGQLSIDSMPALDRFLVLHKGDGFQLYDLKTGKSGDFGIERDDDGAMLVPRTSSPEMRLLDWPIDGGKSYALLDLGAIR